MLTVVLPVHDCLTAEQAVAFMPEAISEWRSRASDSTREPVATLATTGQTVGYRREWTVTG